MHNLSAVTYRTVEDRLSSLTHCMTAPQYCYLLITTVRLLKTSLWGKKNKKLKNLTSNITAIFAQQLM